MILGLSLDNLEYGWNQYQLGFLPLEDISFGCLFHPQTEQYMQEGCHLCVFCEAALKARYVGVKVDEANVDTSNFVESSSRWIRALEA